jgi:hypothetical protein
MMTWWRNVERSAEMPGAFHWLILGVARHCFVHAGSRHFGAE